MTSLADVVALTPAQLANCYYIRGYLGELQNKPPLDIRVPLRAKRGVSESADMLATIFLAQVIEEHKKRKRKKPP